MAAEGWELVQVVPTVWTAGSKAKAEISTRELLSPGARWCLANRTRHTWAGVKQVGHQHDKNLYLIGA